MRYRKNGFIYLLLIMLIGVEAASIFIYPGQSLAMTRPASPQGNDKKYIASIQDINIKIYQNQRIFLPEAVSAKYADGKVREINVNWEEPFIDTSQIGGYVVQGRVEGYSKFVKCIVIVEGLESIINRLIVLPEEAYDKREVDRIIQRISKISPVILEKLLDRGIHIKLINTPVTYLREYAYLRGMVPRGWENTGITWDDVPGVSGNPIAIKIGYSEPGMGHGAINLELHETAHTIDSYLLKGITGSKKFRDIWKKEVNDLFGDNRYFLSYPDEYFAEAFAMYHLDNGHKYELSSRAPLTFKFIEQLEEETGWQLEINQ